MIFSSKYILKNEPEPKMDRDLLLDFLIVIW